eukprot:GILK01008601.1.p1 GENE.GILK01008601.1~~GILK01008601.1.p1  ORF type:complete len:769 (+),score=74.01 GILK01008601.1:37-2343(+)
MARASCRSPSCDNQQCCCTHGSQQPQEVIHLMDHEWGKVAPFASSQIDREAVFGRLSKPRAQEPSMFDILSWAEHEETDSISDTSRQKPSCQNPPTNSASKDEATRWLSEAQQQYASQAWVASKSALSQPLQKCYIPGVAPPCAPASAPVFTYDYAKGPLKASQKTQNMPEQLKGSGAAAGCACCCSCQPQSCVCHCQCSCGGSSRDRAETSRPIIRAVPLHAGRRPALYQNQRERPLDPLEAAQRPQRFHTDSRATAQPNKTVAVHSPHRSLVGDAAEQNADPSQPSVTRPLTSVAISAANSIANQGVISPRKPSKMSASITSASAPPPKVRVDAKQKAVEAIQRAWRRRKARQLESLKANSRFMADSSFRTYYARPAFHAYGRGNLNPTWGGLFYGQYMLSHSISPQEGANNPMYQQVYPQAEEQSLRRPTKPVHPPRKRADQDIQEVKQMTDQFNRSQIFGTPRQHPSKPIIPADLPEESAAQITAQFKEEMTRAFRPQEARRRKTLTNANATPQAADVKSVPRRPSMRSAASTTSNADQPTFKKKERSTASNNHPTTPRAIDANAFGGTFGAAQQSLRAAPMGANEATVREPSTDTRESLGANTQYENTTLGVAQLANPLKGPNDTALPRAADGSGRKEAWADKPIYLHPPATQKIDPCSRAIQGTAEPTQSLDNLFKCPHEWKSLGPYSIMQCAKCECTLSLPEHPRTWGPLQVAPTLSVLSREEIDPRNYGRLPPWWTQRIPPAGRETPRSESVGHLLDQCV